LLAIPDVQTLKTAWAPFWKIGVPAIMTQLATPIGNAYVTGAFASYGDEAVAGWAVVGRLMPLAFAAIFALSGAIGPIIGQNYGAGNRDRVVLALREAQVFCFAYVLGVWFLLFIGADFLVSAFGATGDAASLINAFCVIVAGSFVFNGFLFVANAAFNNLGYALYSTVFNWGRATLGVVPFVYFGGLWFGVTGVLYGWGLGAVAFGVVALIVAFRTVKTMDMDTENEPETLPQTPAVAHSPFSSGKSVS